MCACVLGGRMSKRMYFRFLTIPVNITKIPKNSKTNAKSTKSMPNQVIDIQKITQIHQYFKIQNLEK